MNINEFIIELKKLNIDISDYQLSQLEKYYDLLIEYNKVMNLTTITNKDDVYLKHFYDSLTITKIINLKNVNTLCDIGSGAGFPGIVIKILFPNIKITLVDSLGKRINFLKKVIDELKLDNIEAIHMRAEDFAHNNKEKYEIVTARAVAKLNVLLELSIPLLKINGHFIAMKSNIEDEIKNIDSATDKLKCDLIDIKKFTLPFENSTRTLLKFKKLDTTDCKYPRKFEQIKKKPL